MEGLKALKSCNKIPETETRICVDYSTPQITLTCPNMTAGWDAEPIECTVSPPLGISEPYPCTCGVPPGTMVSYEQGEVDLYSIAKVRDEEGLVWRYVELYSGYRIGPYGGEDTVTERYEDRAHTRYSR